MKDGIYCFMWKGVLTTEAREQLFLTATEMIRGKKGSANIRSEYVEAVVKTNFTPALLGTIPGFLFTAEGESEFGKFEIKYLVRPNEISDIDEMRRSGVWDWGADEPNQALNAHNN